MKTIFCFIRHGETDANKEHLFHGQTDLPLNETGKNQVKMLIDELKQIKWHKIITSPLKRAYQSARIINEILKIDIEINALLIERDFGLAEGIPITNDNYQLIANGLFDKIETEENILIRAKVLFDYLISNYKSQNIILVSHSHFIKAIFKLFNDKITFKDAFIKNARYHLLIIENKEIITSNQI